MQIHTESKLRLLDVDDLYLLSYLGSGLRLIDVARRLCLSQPAITQRVRKIEDAIGADVIDHSYRGTRLTDQGQRVCERVTAALGILEVPAIF